MDVHSLFRVAHTGVRIRLAGEGREHRHERWSGIRVEPVLGRKFFEAFLRNAQKPRRSGDTTSRRSGSSPSLCVSTSVRSAR